MVRYHLPQMSSLQTKPQLLHAIRLWLSVFVLALILSGLTAFPLEHETTWLAFFLHAHPILPTTIISWIMKVSDALRDTGLRYPFLAYGTDWLAFAHLVLAIAFLGPLRDPLRNKWVLQFGVVACISVVFLALIAGPIRGIPFLWRLIDCSFGVFGAIPLLICLRLVNRLQAME